jgi:AraC-like DNA-binding protein
MEYLARIAGMSVFTLHHHFRHITSMSRFSIRNNFAYRQRGRA